MRAPDPRAAAASIAAITKRRTACGDESLELLPDHPLGVLAYVRSHRDVPHGVLAEDAADCLVLLRHLLAEVNHAGYATLLLARAAGLTWKRIGEPFGLSPQGAAQWALRLDEEQHGGQRSEVDARRRLQDGKALPRRTATEIHEEAWLERHTAQIRSAAADLTAAFPDDEDTQEFLGSPSASLRNLMIWIEATSWELEPGQLPAVGRLAEQWRRRDTEGGA